MSYTNATGVFNQHYRQVRAATTANITIASDLNNGDTLDGITLVTGDMVLVKDQTAGAENGIYIVGASPARDPSYNSDFIIRSSKILVREGTTNALKVFACTNTSAITVDSTSIYYIRTVRETINSNVTLTVKATGGDFTTIQGAIDSLSPFEIAAGVTVTIQVDDGTYVHTTALTCTHPNGDKITITGKNIYTKSISNVWAVAYTGNTSNGNAAITNLSGTFGLYVGQVVSGTGIQAGSVIVSIDSTTQITLDKTATATNTGVTLSFAYTRVTDGTLKYKDYVITVDSVTNVSVGDYVLIRDTSGGTNPTYIVGCHQILAIDGTNGRLRIRVFGDMSAAAASTIATTNCVVIKTIITGSVSYSGLTLGQYDQLGILSNIVFVGYSYGGNGISMLGALTVTNVGISQFSYGIRILNPSSNFYSSSGFFVSGCKTQNGFIYQSGNFTWNSGISNGSGGYGCFVQSSRGSFQSNITVGNVSNGLKSNSGSQVIGDRTTSIANTDANQVYCDGMSFIGFYLGTSAQNSPTLDTVGNKNSIISSG